MEPQASQAIMVRTLDLVDESMLESDQDKR